MDCAELIVQQTVCWGDFTPLGEADTHFACVCMCASFTHTQTQIRLIIHIHTHVFSKQTSLLTTLAFWWES